MNEQNKPTESQIEVLMSDWLGNLRAKADGNFTHKGEGGIRRRNTDEDLTGYLMGSLEGLDTVELIKRSRMASEHVINAVMSKPVTIQVGQGLSFCSEQDGRHTIALATDYFDDEGIDNRQKAAIMLGLASHEAAHGVYTDNSLKDEYLRKEPQSTRGLKKEIWNVLEDERIEYLLGDSCPGLADCIGQTKGYFFDRLVNKMKNEGQLPTEPLPRFLNTLMQAVRYPSQLSREDVEQNFDNLDRIRRILSPFPLTPEGVMDATDRVMDVIQEMARDKAQQEQQPQLGQDDQNQNDENDQQQDGQQPRGDKKADNKKKKSGGSPQPSQKDIQKALEQMVASGQTQQMLAAMAEDSQKGQSDNCTRELDQWKGEQVQDYINSDDAECEVGAPGDPRTFIFKPKGSAQQYLESQKEVRKYVPAMAKSLSCKGRDRDYCLHGLPSGKLNTNKLASFKMGNTNIFDKRGTVACSSASVVMLIDESGSMGGRRLLAARQAAILVNEAIKRIPKVNFYCYGYTTDQINVYSEDVRTSRWALGATQATGGTPTGKAMRLCADRVRRLTADPCLMLVLTDGTADNSNEVIEQDRLLRRRAIYPIGIGIQSNSVQSTFKDNVIMTDISRLAVDLGRLTKGKLNGMLVHTNTSD